MIRFGQTRRGFRPAAFPVAARTWPADVAVKRHDQVGLSPFSGAFIAMPMRPGPALALIAALLASPVLASGSALAAGDAHLEKPYRLEPIAGSAVKRVVFTEKAAKRIDIKTGQMSKGANGKLLAPYQAVFYDLKGDPWVYTNPEPLTFVRQKVSIVTISGDTAVLSEGPPDGTKVVTLGVVEVYGTERGIGH